MIIFGAIFLFAALALFIAISIHRHNRDLRRIEQGERKPLKLGA